MKRIYFLEQSISYFKKHLFFLILLLIGLNSSNAQTDFDLGDIAITGYQSDTPDKVSIVFLKDIEVNTQFTMTDKGWLAAGGFRSSEGIVTVMITSALTCGTEVLLDLSAPAFQGGLDVSTTDGTKVGSISGTLSLSNTSGDQVFIYQGTTPTLGDQSSFITALQMNGDWDADATSSSTSARPTVFTDGVNSNFISPEVDNAAIDCATLSTLSGTSLELATAIYSATWDVSGSVGLAIPPDCGFSCTVSCPTITVNTNATNAICTSSTGTASASATGGTGAYTYAWSNGDSGPNITGLASASYTVTATDANSCTGTSTVMVDQTNTMLNVTTMSTDAICMSSTGTASASTTGGTGTITYVWSNSDSGSNITGLASGSYMVTATDANGCTGTSTVMVNQTNTMLNVTTISTDAICTSSTGTASASTTGGTGTITYVWSNGDSGSNITGLASDSYTVTATDANGCTGTSTVMVDQINTMLNVTTISTDAICTSNNGTASASTTGGTGTITYVWSNSDSGSNITGLASDSYTVTATDANGCTGTSTVMVNQINTMLNVTTISTDAICTSNNGTASVSTTGGTGTITYAWSNGDAGSNITGLASGSYMVTATDANGCTGTSNITIGINTINLSVSTNTTAATCFANDGTATASVTGGTGTLTYLWSNGMTSVSIGSLSAGTYGVTATDANGCTGEGSAIVGTNMIVLSVSTSSTNSTCTADNGTTSASVTGGSGTITYEWSNGDTGSNLTNLASSSYTVTATDRNGCTGTSTVAVGQTNTMLTIMTSSTAATCLAEDGTASASATGGTGTITYAWSNGESGASIPELLAGTYTVTATDENGCTGEGSVEVGTNMISLTVNTNSTNSICTADNGTASASATSGTGTITYEWSNGDSGSNITGLASGSYTVTATDVNGCTGTSTVMVNQTNTMLNVTTISTDAICTSNNGTASASTTGGTGTITYAWSNGDSGSNITGLASGTYTVTATDANGCTGTSNITIGINTINLSVSTNTTAATCFANDGTATASVTGGTGTLTYLWSNGMTSVSIGSLSAGTYGVTATDANGCTGEGNAIVGTNTIVLSVSTSSTNSTCTADNGTTSASVTGGSGTITYEWSNGATGSNLTNLSPGSYTVTATDRNGCTGTSTVAVGQTNTMLTIMTSSTDATCLAEDGTASASATGGTGTITYAWSNGESGASIPELSAGTYGVTATDANGCTGTSTVMVGQTNTMLALMTSTTDATCQASDGTATVSVTNGTGGFTYAWSNGETSATINNLSAGTYTVTATDANGCTGEGSAIVGTNMITLTVNTSSTNSICTADNGTATASASGGTAAYTYAWSNGATGSNLTDLSPGSYTVTATDANGCTGTSTVMVGQTNTMLALMTSTTDVTCQASDGTATVSVTNGTGGFTYAWSNGETSATINNLSAGTYTVTATDANGCTGEGSVIVGTNMITLTVNTSSTNSICTADNGTATASASGGTAAYTYAWSNGATGANLTDLSPGSYAVTATDANGCTGTSTVMVGQTNTMLALMTSTTDATCQASDGTATVSVTNGTGGFTYVWSNGETSATINNLSAGTYTVTATDANGCTGEGSAIVGTNMITLTVNTSSTNSICTADNGTATASASGGTAAYTYVWSNGDTGSNLTDLSPGSYTVTATDANGCTGTSTVMVGQTNTMLALMTSTTDVTCKASDGTATVSVTNGTGGFTYAWSNGETSATINNLSAGTYTVTATDANGCTGEGSVIVGTNMITLTVNTSSTNSICTADNGTATASASGGTAAYTYAWSNGATGANLTDLSPGSYTVTATDANGCTGTSTVMVGQTNTMLTVTTMSMNTSCLVDDGTATATATGGTAIYTYVWSNGETGPSLTGLASGSYTVTATDMNGCTGTEVVTIEIDPNPPTIACPADNFGLPMGCNPMVPAGTTMFNSAGMSNPNPAWPTITGGCEPLTLTFTDAMVDVGCNRTITRTYTITDNNGDMDMCDQIFSFTVDTENPVFSTMPNDITVECDAIPLAPMITATDNCGVLTAILSEEDNTTICDGGTITRTWNVEDACGNAAVPHVQVITVSPAVAPMIVCPMNMTVECAEDILVDADDAIITTSCGQAATTVLSGPVIVGKPDCSGATYTYTYTVTDDCGRTASCEQVFTIDNLAPIVVCPADEVVTCFEDINADPANLTVTTSCGAGFTAYVKQPLISGGLPGCDGVVYTYIYKVIDDCGRVSQCEQQFLIQNSAPTVTVPAGQTVSCFEDIQVSVNDVTITDACEGENAINVLPVTINGPANCPGTTYTYTYRVRDFCKRIVEVDRVFTIGNNDGPTIIAPVDYTTQCQGSVNPDNAIVTTSCGNGNDYEITVAEPQITGTPGCSGTTIQYTYTVTDACGRTASDVQIITLENEAPMIDCPETLQIFNCEDGNNNDLISAWIASVTATASCGGNVVLTNNYNGNAGMCINNGFTNVTFFATDQCGRTSTCVGTIIITDTEAPIIYQAPQEVLVPCNGVTQNIFDNWLATQGGAEAIDACWGDNITWSMNPSNPILNCDAGPQAIIVEFIATDGCGNASSVTGIFNTKVQPTTVNISGQINREDATPVSSVEMRVTGGGAIGPLSMDYTELDGDYGFPELEYEENLMISPEKNIDPLNGISTYDLILLRKHILLIESLDSPYKQIAADVNGNGSISTFDLLLLRRLILFIDTEFTSNTSWRFVEADFVFPDPQNPFATPFPEEYMLAGLEEEVVDFIGVKIGDLNLSAIANEFAGEVDDRSGLDDLTFEVKDQQLFAGEAYQIDFTAQNFEQINGFQFTLNLDPTAVEVKSIAGVTLSHFNQNNYGMSKADQGAITLSWNHDTFQNLKAEETAFSLSITANSDVQLSEVLSITSEYTRAEAYQDGELMNVDLAFNNEGTIVQTEVFRLFQNQPNPFKEATMIGFNLPEAGAVMLNIYDVSGRLIYSQQGDFAKGYNQIDLDRANLPSGVLYYHINTATDSDSKKMIVIE